MDSSQEDPGEETTKTLKKKEHSGKHSSSNGGPNSFRKMTLTMPLERLRNALHKNHRSNNDSKTKQKKDLVPPEIALNDSKLSPGSRDRMDPGSRSFSRRKKQHLRGYNIDADQSIQTANQFLTVENHQGAQRKRSSSMNIDDRFALTTLLSTKGKTNSSSLSTVQNLHQPFLGVTKSLNSKSCEIIRNFLLTRESSPFHKFYFATFLGAHRSEVLIPSTSKVIALDSKLTISKAFLALFHNNIRAAPVWNSRTMRYESMLTVTDFIRVLLDRYQMALDVNFERFSKIKIGNWKKDANSVGLVHVLASDSLHVCVKLLVKHGFHRIPILESQQSGSNIIGFATHHKILQFMHRCNFHVSSVYSQTIEDLKIGTFDLQKLHVVNEDRITWEVLKLFHQKDASVLPVVDKQSNFLGLYTKQDVFHLGANEHVDDLMVPVGRWINKFSRKVHVFCTKMDTLSRVIQILCEDDMRYVVILDEEGKLEGLLSVGDVNEFILANQSAVELSDLDDSDSPSSPSPCHSSAASLM